MPSIQCHLADLNRLAQCSRSASEWDAALERVKGELKRYDPASDDLTIYLNDTNRPDLWCPEGIARQVRGKRQAPREVKAPRSDHRIRVDAALQDIRPHVGGFLASGPAVDEALLASLIQTQEVLCQNFGHRRRTLAIGIYRSEAIRFPIDYIAADPDARRFVPLGDEVERSLREILTTHEKGRAYGPLIAGFARFPLLVDAMGVVLSMPPIINSRAVGEVRPGDTRLFVEATGSVLREVRLALDILAANLEDRGYEVQPVAVEAGGTTIVYPSAGLAEPLEVPVREFARLSGIECEGPGVVQFLHSYGVHAELNGNRVLARTPSYRDDYIHAVDVIEDYIMSLGYEAFRPVPPELFTIGATTPLQRFEDHLRGLCIGLGLEEIFSNVLMSREELVDRMQASPSADDGPLRIANVMSETYSHPRDSILPCLYRVEAASARSVYPHRLFEVGEVARRAPEDPALTRTERRLAAGIAHAEAAFADVHQLLTDLTAELRLECELIEDDQPDAIPGRACRVRAGGIDLGRLGETHPAVLEAWGIRMPAAFIELDIAALREALRLGSSRG